MNFFKKSLAIALSYLTIFTNFFCVDVKGNTLNVAEFSIIYQQIKIGESKFIFDTPETTWHQLIQSQPYVWDTPVKETASYRHYVSNAIWLHACTDSYKPKLVDEDLSKLLSDAETIIVKVDNWGYRELLNVMWKLIILIEPTNPNCKFLIINEDGVDCSATFQQFTDYLTKMKLKSESFDKVKVLNIADYKQFSEKLLEKLKSDFSLDQKYTAVNIVPFKESVSSKVVLIDATRKKVDDIIAESCKSKKPYPGTENFANKNKFNSEIWYTTGIAALAALAAAGFGLYKGAKHLYNRSDKNIKNKGVSAKVGTKV